VRCYKNYRDFSIIVISSDHLYLYRFAPYSKPFGPIEMRALTHSSNAVYGILTSHARSGHNS
jgi:hypothetical protein